MKVKNFIPYLLLSLLFLPIINTAPPPPPVTPTATIGPTLTLTPTASPQPDILYTPTPRPAPYFGLAMAMPLEQDASLLGIRWYYHWGPSGQNLGDAEFVPMLWDGLPNDKIPRNYTSWILVLNEPNLRGQADLPPEESQRRLTVLREYYPYAKLVCCGVNTQHVPYVRKFLEAGPTRPDAWHVHAYIMGTDTVPVLQDQMLQMYNLTGGEYWITEYGAPGGQLDWFQAMTEFYLAQPYITRIAPYTNRQPDANEPWIMRDGVELVKSDGVLTKIGRYFQSVVLNSGR